MPKKLLFIIVLALSSAYLISKGSSGSSSTSISSENPSADSAEHHTQGEDPVSTPVENAGDEPLSTSSQAAETEETFDGTPCTSDCSGHQAGYDWAERKDIDDEDDCETAGINSNSPSFAEGCKEYVQESSAGGNSDENDPE